MCEIYVPTKRNNHSIASICLGAFCVLATFALLPLLQGIANYAENRSGPEIIKNPDVLPEQIVEREQPEPVEPEPLDKPKLEEPLIPPTLAQLEGLLNPSDGGVSISVDFVGIGTEENGGIKFFLPEELDNNPRVLTAVKPLIPYDMKGITGSVVVEFIIDANGKVLRPKIYESTHRQFEQAAIEAIKKSQWEPGIRNGEKVASIVRVPVQFKK